MKVHRGLDNFEPIKNAVVTQGTFDGVHQGHQRIIERLRRLAEVTMGETVLLTFYPHPRYVLYPDDNRMKILTTLDEKIEILEQSGIDHLVVMEFTEKFSRQTSLQFIRDILVNKIGTQTLVIGYDHRFGKNREGSFEHLKKYAGTYGFDVEEIPAQDIEDVTISSTKIRKALDAGDVLTANKYLGRDYSMMGKVVPGKRLGRDLGFPTANIAIHEPHKLIPKDGVYAVKVAVNGTIHNGMLNIGYRPTVKGEDRTVEANIFDFSEDIYNQDVKVSFVDKLREEMKFDDLESLKIQLEKDKFAALNILQAIK